MKRTAFLLIAILLPAFVTAQRALVLQTDFGTKDGAVAAMKGVAFGVSPAMPVFDLTHEIPPYNIWEAAYRLYQTATYWPAGTVFVSVIDPGVGSNRKSVVLLTKSGHYFVTPDNGTLTLVAEHLGIEALREIDESRNRLPGSGNSYTFHGRDVYAYTGARLAAGKIPFDSVGPLLTGAVVAIPYQKAQVSNNKASGNIPILDVQYGNVWTNIGEKELAALGIRYGDRIKISIYHENLFKHQSVIPFVTTFSAVQPGFALAYYNSLMQLSFAVNEDSFSGKYQIGSGPGWRVEIEKFK